MRRILLIAWLGLPLAASAATPVLVRDLDPRLSEPNQPNAALEGAARAGSRLVFVARPGQAGKADLWATDGTTEGTRRLRSFAGEIGILGSTGNVVFFGSFAADARFPDRAV